MKKKEDGQLTVMTGPAYAISYGWPRTIPGCHPFMGAHNFERGGRERPWQRGVSMALFKTRSDARDALQTARRRNPQAKVVKVSIAVNWIGYGAERLP